MWYVFGNLDSFAQKKNEYTKYHLPLTGRHLHVSKTSHQQISKLLGHRSRWCPNNKQCPRTVDYLVQMSQPINRPSRLWQLEHTTTTHQCTLSSHSNSLNIKLAIRIINYNCSHGWYIDDGRNTVCPGRRSSWVMQQAAWPPGATDTVCLRPHARIHLHRPLQLAVTVDSACSIGVQVLKFLSLPVR